MLRLAVLIAVAVCLASQATHAFCRQALALGLDVSGSVDTQEYGLQRDGIAAALQSAPVRSALLEQGPPVALAVFEWSAENWQRLVVDWTLIDSNATLQAVITTIANSQRGPAPDGTALGQALIFGAQLLERNPGCQMRTLDISGDGKNNQGRGPGTLSVRNSLSGSTVNALVIGSDDKGPQDTRQADIAELSAYFNRSVIYGPNSFVQVAIGFEDYAAAMEKKLLRELKPILLGGSPLELNREGGGRTSPPRVAESDKHVFAAAPSASAPLR